MLHLAVLSIVDPGGLGPGPRTNVPQQAENTESHLDQTPSGLAPVGWPC